MKRSLLLLLILLLAAPAWADTYLGYTNGNIVRGSNNYRFGNATTQQGLLFYVPAAKAAALQGQRLKGVRTALSTRQYSNLQLYVSKDLTGAPLSEQALTGTNSTNSFATFTAADPVTLDGEAFYVGITLTIATSYAPLYFDAGNDFAQEGLFWAWGDQGWQDVTHLGLGAPFLQLILEGDVPVTDVIVKSATALDADGRSFLQAESPINVTAQVFNFGTTTITGYDLVCQVGDEETRFSSTDVSIAPGQDATVAVNGYVSQTGGDLPLQVRVENILTDASTPEADTSDNATESQAYVYPLSCQKRALLEIYTGAYCSNCPTGHVYLEQAMGSDRDNFVVVNHHSYVANAATDLYSVYESLIVSYWLGVTGFPSASYNRMQVTTGDECVAYFATSLASDQAGVAASLKTEPYVSIDLDNAFNADSRQGTLTARLHAYNLPSSTSGNYRINVWMLQDSLVGYQASGGTSYVHNDVVRKFLTDSYGDPVSLVKGEDVELTFPYEIPAEGLPSTGYTYYSGRDCTLAADLPHMKFVVSVGEVSGSNVDSPIFNVAEVPLLDGTAGIEAVRADDDRLAGSSACYDLMGRRVDAPRAGQVYVRGAR